MRLIFISALAGCWLTAAMADAQEVLVFQGDRYTAQRGFSVGAATVMGYARADQAGSWHFTVRVKGRLPSSYRYQATLASGTKNQEPAKLLLYAFDEPADAKDSPEWLRVAVKVLDKGAQKFPDAALAAVKEAEEAAPAWYTAKALLKDTASTDRAKAHEAWRTIAALLEEARRKHPWHLGVLRDLIAAYANLNAFEGRSARGANLCVLIPQCIAEFELSAPELSKIELTEFRRTLAVLFFQTELYPLARMEIDKAKGDEELIPLKKALQTLGQDSFEPMAPYLVKEKTLTYRVVGFEAKGKPADPKQIYHHWYFLPRAQESGEAPGRVWYTLSSQVLTKEPRYYLYAHGGNQRKVIMLYGAKKPGLDEVQKRVAEVVTDGLRAALEKKAPAK